MGERLAGGNTAVALLANSLATGFALVALIVAFGQRSGAHFNPVVTLSLAATGAFARRDVVAYVGAQVLGALAGVAAAHAMFDMAIVQFSATVRSGAAQWWSEIVASFGLVFVVLSLNRRNAWAAPFAVGGYIAAAYWFTASTSFANPAVTLARGFSATFSGIALADAPAFMMAQAVGAVGAVFAARSLSISRR
jgi:glycerol uptake facilitator-like aquaporin